MTSPFAPALIHLHSLHLLPYSIPEFSNQYSPHHKPARGNHVNSVKVPTSRTSLKAAAYRRNGTSRKYEAIKRQRVQIQVQLLFLQIPKLYPALPLSQLARKAKKVRSLAARTTIVSLPHAPVIISTQRILFAHFRGSN
ncbi:unnamed protein product [Sphenostylis stenocarpa]|uniref:Uncharacterized protein n=1 Tax=Sphenostylis stenocarpa TaxID=92480 RepID=A0AA86VWM8_9FABA|nr:unnamed protein product [Sphenostylis stenocarpa]